MQWQYKMKTGSLSHPEDFIKELDKLGRDGWEAVGFIQSGMSSTVLMKRQMMGAPSSKATWEHDDR
jgi:hypothetical protein